MVQERFRAFVVDRDEAGFGAGFRTLSVGDLPDGEVTIRVLYSSVNFKDGLASSPNGKVVRGYPMVPGIDLAGVVVKSSDSTLAIGDEVLVTGYDLGVSHFGGYSEYATVPPAWVVPLPPGLTPLEAMTLGTAGFTAALSVHRLEANGLRRDQGPVLVTGATGGVGSTAVGILARLGYEVVASTGKTAETDYLKSLGAGTILDRAELQPESIRPMDKERWAGAVDPVGGRTLSYLLSTVKYGGSVAVSGLTGGADVETTVFPFILRGINLLGIDSVQCPMKLRKEIWRKLANDWKPIGLSESIAHVLSFEDLPHALEQILKGKLRGRTVVQIGQG